MQYYNALKQNLIIYCYMQVWVHFIEEEASQCESS